MNMDFIDFRGCFIFIFRDYIAFTQPAAKMQSDVQCRNTRGHYGEKYQPHNPERDPDMHAGPFLGSGYLGGHLGRHQLEGHWRKEEGCFVIVPDLFSNSITHSQLLLYIKKAPYITPERNLQTDCERTLWCLRQIFA